MYKPVVMPVAVSKTSGPTTTMTNLNNTSNIDDKLNNSIKREHATESKLTISKTELGPSEEVFMESSKNSVDSLMNRTHQDVFTYAEINLDMDSDQLIYEDYNDIPAIDKSEANCNDCSDRQEELSIIDIESDNDESCKDMIIIDEIDENEFEAYDNLDIIEIFNSKSNKATTSKSEVQKSRGSNIKAAIPEISKLETADNGAHCTKQLSTTLKADLSHHIQDNKFPIVLKSKTPPVEYQTNMKIKKRTKEVYTKIYIVGNPTYHPYLERFKQSAKVNVKFITGDLIKSFPTIKETKKSRGLWLVFFGLESIGSLKYRSVCETSLCKRPMYQFNLNSDLQDGNVEAAMSPIIRSLKSLEHNLRALVNRNSHVIIMPLYPVHINTQSQSHTKLHSSIKPPFHVESIQISKVVKALTLLHQESASVFNWNNIIGFQQLMSMYKSSSFSINDTQSVNLNLYIKHVERFINSSLTGPANQQQTSITVINKPPVTLSDVRLGKYKNATSRRYPLVLGRFDHIVFLGVDGSPIMRGFEDSKHISFVPSRFPISWKRVQETLSHLEKDNKSILLVIVCDISALTTRVELPKANFNYHVFGLNPLEQDEKALLSNVEMLYKNCVKYFNSAANVLIAPFYPRYLRDWPKTKFDQELVMNDAIVNSQDCPVYVNCLENMSFEKCNLFHKQYFSLFADSRKVKNNNYFCAMGSAFYRELDESAGNWVRLWREYVHESIKDYGDKKLSGRTELYAIGTFKSNEIKICSEENCKKRKIELVAEEKLMPESKRKKVTPIHSVVKATPNAITCPSFLHNKHLPQYVIAKKLANSMYEHAYIIGPLQVIKKLSTFQFNQPLTFIAHDFSGNLMDNIASLDTKLTPIIEKSVCFIIYDINYLVLQEVTVNFCRRNNCDKPLTVLKIINKKEGDFQKFVCDRIQMANAFMKRYDSTVMTCFPLPLPPHSLFCKCLSNLNHSVAHCISERCCMLVNSKDYWNKYCDFLLLEWAKLLRQYYKDHKIMYDLFKFLNYVMKDFYKSSDEPSLLTDQSNEWIIYKDILTQLLTWVRLQNPRTTVFSTNDQIPETQINMDEDIPKRGNKSISTAYPDKKKAVSQICELKLFNFSGAITHNFIIEIVKELKKDFKSSSNADGSLSLTLPLETAKLIQLKLNGLRITHTKMKVECVNFKDVKINYTHKDCVEINSIFYKQVSRRKEIINREIMKPALNNGINIAEFKTQNCNGRCTNDKLCSFSHNSCEKRRNPFIHKYRTSMCAKVNWGYCPDGNSCRNSHSAFEQKYHPSTYQMEACKEQMNGKCLKSFCEFYHTGTPEMLFTPEWEDRIIFGLENTVTYFDMAVKSLGKLQDHNQDLTKILLISPSVKFLLILKSIFVSTFESCQKSCSLLNNKYVNNEDHGNILLATPKLLGKYTHMIGDKLSKISLIIIDDFKTIIDDTKEAQSLFVFMKHLKNFIKFSDVGLVVSVEEFENKIPHVASRFLNASFKIFTDSGTPLPVSFPDRVGIKRTKFELSQNNTYKAPNQECFTENHITAEKNKDEEFHFENTSSSNIPIREEEFVQQTADVSRHQIVQGSNFYSNSSGYMPRNEPETPVYWPSTPVIPGTSFTEQSYGGQTTSYVGQSACYDGQSTRYDNQSTSCDDQSTRYNDPSTRYGGQPTNYNDQSTKYHNQSTNYNNQSTNYNNQSTNYNNQSTNYNNQSTSYSGQSVSRTPSEMKLFPINRQRNAELSEANSRTEEDRYTIHTALIMLETFNRKYKLFEPEIDYVISHARSLEPDTSAVLNHLNKDPNVAMIKSALHKIVMYEASAQMAPLFENVFEHVTKLLNLLHHPKPQLKWPDVGKIARATIHKDAVFVLDVIKTTLAYHGHVNPSNELINKLFLEVCALHFNMTVGSE